VGHVECIGEMRNVYKILVGEPKRNRKEGNLNVFNGIYYSQEISSIILVSYYILDQLMNSNQTFYRGETTRKSMSF
jgi:hypothetical protein